MFISIINKSQDGEARSINSLYECDSFSTYPTLETPTQFEISWQGRKKGSYRYDTTEKGLGIFVMNDQGRTIDTIFRSQS